MPDMENLPEVEPEYTTEELAAREGLREVLKAMEAEQHRSYPLEVDGVPTLGGIQEVLMGLKLKGVSKESVQYVIERVWWES